MDYKEKYEKALEKATVAYKDEDRHLKATLERIFPELAESEDEKIRKGLIAIITDFDSLYLQENYFLSREETLAWLEKQGEQPNKVSIWKHWKDGIAGNGEGKLVYLVKVGNTYRLTSSLAFECDYIELSELDSFMFEKQGEQKPADKVEPKFKVGDWIIHNKNTELANSLMLVTGKNNDEYLCRYRDGQCSYNIEFIDKEYRLWTIQDAKDGDVLCTKNNCCPFIYDKGRYNNGLAYYYAGIDVSGNLNIKSPHNMLAHFGRLDNIRPATQEQRDLLFQKMKEAGYEWDAEKKELKKIEQKPAWSEEDEKILDRVITNYESGYLPSVEKRDEIIEKLKSLKDRVQLQPKQEWSEEDEKMLNKLLAVVALYYGYCGNVLDKQSCTSFLKSLKERYTWKPSEREKEALLWCVVHLGGADKQTLGELLEALNKL